MAVRKDTVQLNIEFITDESRALAKANVNTKALTTELRKTMKAGGDVADVMRRISAAGAKVEDLDLSRIAPAQLITRGRQLRQILSQLPESAPGVAKLQAEYKRINDRLADIRQSTRGVASAFGKGRGGLLGSVGGLATKLTGVVAIAAGAVAAFRGIFNAISSGVRSAAEFEQLNVSLTTFLGSADRAKEVIADLNDFSVRTPFEPEQVNRAGKALLAFGIEQEKLIPVLTRIGDVAAGTGKDFNELALIYGKARAAGRIQGEELNQLAEAGIPIYEELGEALNVPTENIRKLGEQGKLSFEDLDRVFQNLTAEGGRFNGLLEAQSQTLTGLASTARGALSVLGRNLGEAFTPLLKTILPPVIRLITRFTQRIAPLVQVVGQQLVGAFRFLQRIFAPLVASFGRLGSALGGITEGTGIFADLMKLVASALALVVNAVAVVVSNFSRLLSVITGFGGGGGSIFQTLFVTPIAFAIRVLTQFIAVLNGLVSASKVAFDQLGSIGSVFSDNIALAFDRIKGLFTDNEAAINARQAKLANTYRKLGSSLGDAFLTGYRDAVNQSQITSAIGGADAGAGASDGGASGPTSRQIDDTKARDKALSERLKSIEEAAARENALVQRSLLTREITEKESIARLSAIREQSYRDQLAAYEQFGQGQVSQAEEIRTQLAGLEARRAESSAGAVQGLGAGQVDAVARRNVDAQLEALTEQGKREAEILQRLRDDKRINEEQFELGRLELKRTLALEEIEILRQGTAEEVTLANEKKEQIGEIDQQIFDKKAALAAQEAELRKNLEELKVQTAQEGLDAIVAVLGRDEAARKKNAGALKAFQKGQAIVAGLVELQQIRTATAAQAASVAAIPGAAIAVNVLGAIRAAASIAQTAVTVGKINAQQFARGGGVKFGRFGGNRHSSGGNRGVFEDGTQVEVERGEDFFILSRQASAERARLSALNEASGGVPFFERGGNVFSAPATTPTISSGLLPAAGSTDTSAMTGTMSALLDAFQRFPTKLTADVVYGDITDAGDDLNTARYASEI